MRTDFQTDHNTLAEISSVSDTKTSRETKLRWAAFAVVVVVGFIRVWVGRYSMTPDGMCYLDLGNAFLHRKWFDVVNGYWSPLYAWLLGAALSVAKPARWWEFPVAHAVNFVIYLAAFAGFEFFVRSLLQQLRHDNLDRNTQTLSEFYLLAIGYQRHSGFLGANK
jgi:hypothetical protein